MDYNNYIYLIEKINNIENKLDLLIEALQETSEEQENKILEKQFQETRKPITIENIKKVRQETIETIADTKRKIRKKEKFNEE